MGEGGTGNCVLCLLLLLLSKSEEAPDLLKGEKMLAGGEGELIASVVSSDVAVIGPNARLTRHSACAVSVQTLDCAHERILRAPYLY